MSKESFVDNQVSALEAAFAAAIAKKTSSKKEEKAGVKVKAPERVDTSSYEKIAYAATASVKAAYKPEELPADDLERAEFIAGQAAPIIIVGLAKQGHHRDNIAATLGFGVEEFKPIWKLCQELYKQQLVAERITLIPSCVVTKPDGESADLAPKINEAAISAVFAKICKHKTKISAARGIPVELNFPETFKISPEKWEQIHSECRSLYYEAFTLRGMQETAPTKISVSALLQQQVSNLLRRQAADDAAKAAETEETEENAGE